MTNRDYFKISDTTVKLMYVLSIYCCPIAVITHNMPCQHCVGQGYDVFNNRCCDCIRYWLDRECVTDG